MTDEFGTKVRLRVSPPNPYQMALSRSTNSRPTSPASVAANDCNNEWNKAGNSQGESLEQHDNQVDALGIGQGSSGGSEKRPNNIQKMETTCIDVSCENEPPSFVACMPTERNAIEYNMNHKRRGLALIFNHEFFDIPSLEKRSGTNIDCEKLKKSLANLDFEVYVYKDCKLRELLEHIERAANEDHRDNDCIAIAILSHGELGYLYAKDVMYKLENIWHYFTATACPTLAGKPKLFFIQACRGDRLDPGIKLQKTETDGESSINGFNSMTYRIPIHADFLIAYSTISGFYSWRNTSHGSWFIQSLVEELNRNGKCYDILTLLTFVNQRVAIDFESCVRSQPFMDQQKQIPCVTSMLTRLLRFRDKNKITHV